MAKLRTYVHRGARIAAWSAGALVSLAGMVVLALLVAVHTDWGRDQIRAELVSALDDKVRGHARIGALEGSILTGLQVRDVRIEHPDGEPAVVIDMLRLDYDVLELPSNRLDSNLLVVRGAHVWLRRGPDGRLDLANLLISSDGEPLTVDIDQVELRAGAITFIEEDGEVVSIDRLHIDAAVNAAAEQVSVALERASARWVERDVTVTASGELDAEGAAVRVRDARVAARETRVEVPSASWNGDQGAAEGRFSLAVAAEDVRWLSGDPRWRADVSASGTVRRMGEAAPWVAVLRGGTLGGAQVDAEVRVRPQRPDIHVQLAVEQVDPSHILRTAPAGTLGGSAELWVQGQSLETATGAATLTLAGSLAQEELESVRLVASLDQGTVSAELSAQTQYGALEASGSTDLLDEHMAVTAQLDGTGLRWQQARARSIHIEASVRGPWDRPSGRATLDARRLIQGDIRLGRLRATAVLSDGERIDATVRASGASTHYAAAARLTARLQGERVAVRLRKLTLRTREVTWEGSGAVAVGPADRIQVDGLRLASSAGTLEAGGTIWRGGTRGALQVHVQDMSLAALRRAVPVEVEAPPVRGTVSLDARVRLAPLQAEASGQVAGLTWRSDAPPLTGAVQATLDQRLLAMHAVASGGQVGRVEVAAELETPRRLLAPDAWTPFDRKQLKLARVSLGSIDLARLAALFPEPPDIEGIVSGEVEIRDGADRITSSVQIRAARSAPLRRTFDIDVRGEGSSDAIDAQVWIERGETQVATAELSIAAGVGQIWQDPEAVAGARVGATIEIPRLSLARVAAFLDVDEPVRGHVEGTARLAGTLEEPRVELDARAPGAGVRSLVFERLRVQAHVDKRSWSMQANGAQRQGGTVALRAQGASRADTELQGTLHASELGLALLNPLLADSDSMLLRVGGAVSTELTLAGTAEAPDVRGWIRVREGSARFRQSVRPLRGASIDIDVRPDQLEVRASARSGGGRIRLAGTGEMADWVPERFTANVQAQRFPFVAGGAKVALDIEADVDGDATDQGLWQLSAIVRDGMLRLPKRITSRELHSTAAPQDVVYVDARGRQQATREAARARQQPSAGQRGAAIQLSLRTANPIRVRGDGDIDLYAHADMEVTALAGVPAVHGSIEVTRGTATLFGRRYDIERGQLGFGGSVPLDPQLDIQLFHAFRSVNLLIVADGTLREPRIELSSDPGSYSRAELLGFMLGSSPDQPRDEGRSLGEGAASAASALVAGKLESMVERRIPVDTLRIGSDKDEPDELSFVTVGKWLDEDLFVAYRRRFQADEDENANEATVEYHFLRRWLLEATIGDQGAGSLDVLWVKRY